MPIIGSVIRPPAEADSFLLQVTVGCSAAQCAFCAAYADKSFCVKPADEINADIRNQAARHPYTRRIFLLDGDALVLPNRQIIPILQSLRASFPTLSRISSYANAFHLCRRTERELSELAAENLKLVYVGLESGAQSVLDRVRKRATVAESVEGVRRAAACGIKSSVMVLLGLGGREASDEHVRETIDALNRMQPRYLSLLSLMLIEGTPLFQAAGQGFFTPLSDREMLRETRALLAGLELEGTVFTCNHASNFLPLAGRLPRDRERLLSEIDAARAGRIALRPEWLRGL
ncbi:MAG: radical SAM protein [Candidatus Omnitrophica bacterium]|nr:radical SAM protein [Candidatus Omnitrophota bacterium]